MCPLAKKRSGWPSRSTSKNAVPHPGLRATVYVERHAAREADALEPAVAAVVIKEIGVRIVGDEQIDPPVIVVVRGDDAEAVGRRGIGETVRRGRFHEGPVAAVLEEEIGLARQARRADHRLWTAAPGEQSLRPGEVAPARAHVPRDV